MTTRSHLEFSADSSAAVREIESIDGGRGWCNVVPQVLEKAEELKVSAFGVWMSHGIAVASFVSAPLRHGAVQPSQLGLLHTRGRLGRARITSLLGDISFTVRQDHSHRGLLLDVPPGVPATKVLDAMCTLTSSFCDYQMTGIWRLDLFIR